MSQEAEQEKKFLDLSYLDCFEATKAQERLFIFTLPPEVRRPSLNALEVIVDALWDIPGCIRIEGTRLDNGTMGIVLNTETSRELSDEMIRSSIANAFSEHWGYY